MPNYMVMITRKALKERNHTITTLIKKLEKNNKATIINSSRRLAMITYEGPKEELYKILGYSPNEFIIDDLNKDYKF